MSSKILKTVFIEAGIEPASAAVPKSYTDQLPTTVEAVRLHEMSFRRYRLILDPESRPTQNTGLWYHGHFGMAGGPSTMLLQKEDLLRFKQQLERFAHEEIAAANLAHINDGLAVIDYLQNSAVDRITETSPIVTNQVAVIIAVTEKQPIVLSGPSPRTEHRLAL